MNENVPEYRYEATVVLTPDTVIKADDLAKVINGKNGNSLEDLKQWVEEQSRTESKFDRADILDLETNDRWQYDRWFREWSLRKG